MAIILTSCNSTYGTQREIGKLLGTELLTQPITLRGTEGGMTTVLGNFTNVQFRVGDVAKLTPKRGAPDYRRPMVRL
jgi:hypothetical protein